jgi:hypothetical protein
MTTDTVPTPPQIKHLFVRGLRFEGELKYLAKASGKHGARFREIRTPKPGRDGGLAWCSVVAGGILGIWPLAEHAQSHDGWKSTDASTIDQLIRQGGLAMVQLGDGDSKWWALVTGVERDKSLDIATALLLLDVTQPLPWGTAYNARVGGINALSNPHLAWRSADGANLRASILRWVAIDGPKK